MIPESSNPDTAGTPDLAMVVETGSYTDLSDTPELSRYVLLDQLAAVARIGKYAGLDGLPDGRHATRRLRGRADPFQDLRGFEQDEGFA